MVPHEIDNIYTHPNNIKLFDGLNIDHYHGIDIGLPIFIDEMLPETKPIGKVKFPDWKFCEFEEKDEGWALALGIATREEEPVFYNFSNRYPISLEPIIIDFNVDEYMLEKIQQDMINSLNRRFYEFTTNYKRWIY